MKDFNNLPSVSVVCTSKKMMRKTIVEENRMYEKTLLLPRKSVLFAKFAALAITWLFLFSLLPVKNSMGTEGIDTAGDGLTDGDEGTLGTNHMNPDTDGDGLYDGWRDNGFDQFGT